MQMLGSRSGSASFEPREVRQSPEEIPTSKPSSPSQSSVPDDFDDDIPF
jgi:hypothetical protein